MKVSLLGLLVLSAVTVGT